MLAANTRHFKDMRLVPPGTWEAKAQRGAVTGLHHTAELVIHTWVSPAIPPVLPPGMISFLGFPEGLNRTQGWPCTLLPAQQVKDLALSLHCPRSLPRFRFSPWPGNFHMLEQSKTNKAGLSGTHMRVSASKVHVPQKTGRNVLGNVCSCGLSYSINKHLLSTYYVLGLSDEYSRCTNSWFEVQGLYVEQGHLSPWSISCSTPYIHLVCLCLLGVYAGRKG